MWDFLGLLVELMLDIVDWDEHWRFGSTFVTSLGLGALLQWLAHSHVPDFVIYVPLGFAGALIGWIWERAAR